MGDREKGLVYRLCPDCSNDNGDMIIRERITPLINPQATRIVFDSVELSLQVGQDSNINPLIMFDWSDDEGRSWSNDRQVNIGAIGEFKKRVIFRRLGQSFGRVFRLRISDPARLVILGAKGRIRA